MPCTLLIIWLHFFFLKGKKRHVRVGIDTSEKETYCTAALSFLRISVIW